MGREVAPGHVVYEDELYGEVVYRQPKTAGEVQLVLSAAWHDPFGAYAADGDEHWTLELLRQWWADRRRLAAWIDDAQRRQSLSERAVERDNAAGLRDFAEYWTTGWKPIYAITDSGWITDGQPGRRKRFHASTSRRARVVRPHVPPPGRRQGC